MREAHKHYARILRGLKEPSFRRFPFWGFGSASESPWSVGIISLRGNIELNLVDQWIVGKILISNNLGVGRCWVLFTPALWKSSFFRYSGQYHVGLWKIAKHS